MDRNDYLILNGDGKPSHKIRIGSGTTVISSPTTCYELNYRKLFDGKALSAVQNIVKATNRAEANNG